MENKVKEIILNKEFVELSANEREILSEWCQDDTDFEELKRMLRLADELSLEESILVPGNSVKNKLNQEFKRQYRSRHPKVSWLPAKDWFLFTRRPVWYSPALQFAFLAILALIALPFFMQQETTAKIRVAKMENKNAETSKPNSIDTNDASTNESDTPVSTTVEVPEESNAVISDPFDALEDIPAFAESISEMDETVATRASGAAHPDGVYEKQYGNYSQAVSEQQGVLDLLYPTF